MIWIIHKLAMLMVVLSGCSFGMHGIDPNWDRQQEPECTDSYAPVIIDGMMASVTATALSEIAEQGYPLEDSIVAGAIIISLVYTVSALTGVSKYNGCRVARADWHAREAIRASKAKAEPNATSSSAPRPRAAASSPAAPNSQISSTTSARQPTPTVSQGYYCTSSSSQAELNVCVRGRTACEHARKTLALPDIEDCAPRSIAWCFDIEGKPRCFGTQHACELTATATAVASPCTTRP